MISRRGENPFELTLGFMQSAPVIAIALEGVEAIKIVRQMAGTTEPAAAVPGTIRGDYAHVSFGYANGTVNIAIKNLLHASGDAAEAEQEIAHRFKPEELFVYERADEGFMY